MDAALRRFSDFGFPDETPPVAAPNLDPEGFAEILRLRPNQAPPEPARRERPRSITPGDITSALDLVHEAAASILEADGRLRESEARTHALLQRAAEELRAAEARAQAADARARAAEARAEEAENWLRQIFATISEELPPRA